MNRWAFSPPGSWSGGTGSDNDYRCSGKILDIPEGVCYNTREVKEFALTGEAAMDALEMTLLYDFYGGMLTEKQRECFDMRYNQDLSLGEIAQALGVSRQAVCDNLARTEALLRRMEENIGCVGRSLRTRKAVSALRETAARLAGYPDPAVSALAGTIASAAHDLEE